MRACLSLAHGCDGRRRAHARRPERACRACRRCSARSRSARRLPVRLLHARHAGQRARAARTTTPSPTTRRCARALSGNLCRCTGYVKIVAAVQAAAATLREEATRHDCHRARQRASQPTRSARRSPQLEGDDKLSGRAQYIADLYRPGMLHGAIAAEPACACAHPRLRPERGAGAAGRARDRHRRRCRRATTAWAPSSRTSRRWPRARCATSARSSPRWRPTPRRSRARPRG